MGRFRAKRIIIRELPELTIVFWDWSSIYVYPKGDRQGYVFHKWYAPRGTYFSSWKPFKRKLLKTKRLNFSKCCQLASQYNIDVKGSVGKLNFENKPVEIRFLKWKVSGFVRKD